MIMEIVLLHVKTQMSERSSGEHPPPTLSDLGIHFFQLPEQKEQQEPEKPT